MEGFDPRWADPPDYILGVTHEIWEGRNIAALMQYYADDIIVRSPASVVTGNANVISATQATLAEFPDRKLLGEDVIWCPAETGGFLSSHRLMSTATHSHDGAYRAATGKALRYRIIADCHACKNRIDDEWLVRDQGAIARQLGYAEKDYARHLIKAEGGPDTCVKPFVPADDRPGPYGGTGNGDPWGAQLAGLLTRLSRADFTAITECHDRAALLHYPCGEDTQGHEGADPFWMGLFASFPGAVFRIHHAIGREDPSMPPRAAVRWSLDGTHSGWGRFGRPSGAPVHVMGFTHAEFGPKTVRREWTLLDDVAVWKQILLHSGEL